jgi:uncharacterized protein (TIGR00255 family)
LENKTIQSMTGYGRAEASGAGIKAVCEMKSLNGRYLDIDIRLPRYLMEIDADLRRMLGEKLERGSVTVVYNIEFTNEQAAPEVKVNEALARAYFNKLSELSHSLELDFRDPFNQILRIPDVISTTDKTLTDEARQLIVKLTAEAAEQLMSFRKQEGSALGKKLQEAVIEIRKQLEVVEGEEDSRRNGLRERINGSVAEHVRDTISDSSRLELEILLYLEKWDIAEEKQRLSQHLNYFEECLKKEPLGRKLNFIAQEMGREMNTMGVKSNHYPMQQAVVLMKEKLEQIKEQVLNIV